MIAGLTQAAASPDSLNSCSSSPPRRHLTRLTGRVLLSQDVRKKFDKSDHLQDDSNKIIFKVDDVAEHCRESANDNDMAVDYDSA